jgi:hypothetical protein
MQLLNTTFLAMTKLTQKFEPYFRCSAIAETRAFDDR